MKLPSVLPLEREEQAVDVALVGEAQAFDHDSADGDEELECGGGIDAGNGGYHRLGDFEQRDFGDGDDVCAARAFIDQCELTEKVAFAHHGELNDATALMMNDAAGAFHYDEHAIADFILPDDDFTGFCGERIEQFEQLAHFLVGELPEKDGFLKLLAQFVSDHVNGGESRATGLQGEWESQ